MGFNRKKTVSRGLGTGLAAFFMWVALIPSCFAEVVVINGQKTIEQSTVYKNVTLDLDKGSIVIANNATLALENAVIHGTISPQNPFLIQLLKGQLILKNSSFNVSVSNISATPLDPAMFFAIQVVEGKVNLVGNRFDIDTPFTAGLLTTGRSLTSDFVIQHNKIYHFHGAIFLSYSSNAVVSDNYFSRVSLSNILTKNGFNHLFQRNIMLFSENNGMDILDSDKITLRENHIFQSSCYSLLIMRSRNLLIERNSIVGGKTYAFFIAPTLELRKPYDKFLAKRGAHIRIFRNYISQNRYGLTALAVDGLEVRDNIFIQHFPEDEERRFWTNNDVLLNDIVNLTWRDNFYKEAFPQDFSESLEKYLKRVEFPVRGGVSLVRPL